MKFEILKVNFFIAFNETMASGEISNIQLKQKRDDKPSLF